MVCTVFNGFYISFGVGCCFIHSKGNARAREWDRAVSSHTFIYIRFHLGIVRALYSPTMKKTGFNLICKLWCTILLCAGILIGCDLLSGGNSATLADSNQSIRPCKIDMAGVQGFAIVESTSNAPRTKADRDGDGVDDDMPNGNGVVNTSPYSLYTIDENGDLQVSIFYFEAAPSEDGQVNNGPNEQVLKELTGVLQIVPSLVTDLGKYILFSGCQYHIADSEISDEAKTICDTFIQDKSQFYDVVYMIRKSDGALFDLTDRFFFCYSECHEWHTGKYLSHYEGLGFYIPSVTYPTSIRNNLFVLGNQPRAVYKVEDNGDAVDFKQMTQDVVGGFCVDSSENIYVINWGLGDDYGREIHIYGANGGFNLHRFDSDMWFIDMKTDESGVPFIFLTSSDRGFMSARLTNCAVEVMSETDFSDSFYNYKAHQYIGYYNHSYNWCDYSSILSYNKNTHQWSLRNLSNDILQILSAFHDAIVYGSKTYCATVKGNSIEVIEIELASETYRSYSLNIDMNFIPTSFGGRMIQDVPYMIIEGRSPINGTEVTFTIDLISGVNNSTFAQDGRNVVSFFRIN